jgi:hypothetical protein
MKFLSESLQAHPYPEKVAVLVCKSNSGNFTYDGIDTCAERTAREVKSHLKDLSDQGHHIKKFSIVGYSLGGLIARYVVGVLDHDGFFEDVQPVNFTTFASPHLGARSSLNLWTSHVYNTVAPGIVATSGQQLFLADKFHDTGKPLLVTLADPDSIFVHALAKFEKRTIYSNIINDRMATFYTTSISESDPYAAGLGNLKMNYVKGYGEVVIDGSDPCQPLSEEDMKIIPATPFSEIAHATSRKVAKAAIIGLISPIFMTALLAVSSIEVHRSRRRIQVHASEKGYGITNFLQNMSEKVDHGAESLSTPASATENSLPKDATGSLEMLGVEPSPTPSVHNSELNQPGKLALLPEQVDMVKSLNAVGFDKFHVYIHKCDWSHAAIIRREPRTLYDEGKIVISHWLETQFQS